MNHITIELCADDRARIDRLTMALEALQPPKVTITPPKASDFDPVGDAITAQLEQMRDRGATATEAPTETPKETAEATEATDAPVTPPTEEVPTEEAEPIEEKPTITRDMVQQKITTLAAAEEGKYKTQVREIVKAYAPMVSRLPEDKFPEIWAELNTFAEGVGLA